MNTEIGDATARRKAVSAVVAFGVAVAAVAVTAACASGMSGKSAGKLDPSLPADQVMHAAAQSVLAADGVHVHGTVTVTGGAGAGGGAAGDSTVVIDGPVRFGPKMVADLSLAVKPDSDDVPDRVIYDGSTLYAKAPPNLHAKVVAKPNATWFAIPSDDHELFGVHLPVKLGDPAGLVSGLLAEGKFARVGAETADGVATVRYAAEFAGGKPAHVDVWLNHSGLPVELRVKAGNSLGDLHFTDWGKPVKITAPKADEVMNPTDQVSFSMSASGFTVTVGSGLLDGSSFSSSGVYEVPPGPSSSTCIAVTFTPSAPSGASATTADACIDIGSLTFQTLSAPPTATGS
ncbi:hypothetical protein Caci_6660 [Catenulispora acidiphila DSM 44928]|uniref:Lipoprotein n=2 Tax=Catenulispora TaxID=414878 RepID=C7Q013_CATAD|nr:hypothetical protein Caci_6660 [Catenulispora acidiphila DSM 44928]